MPSNYHDERRRHDERRTGFEGTREGGMGLPANPVYGEQIEDDDATVYLFTCCNCGFRAVNPPGPLSACGCGGEIVAHKFDPREYARIRWWNDPRKEAVDAE
jgi:hypothetical protein